MSEQIDEIQSTIDFYQNQLEIVESFKANTESWKLHTVLAFGRAEVERRLKEAKQQLEKRKRQEELRTTLLRNEWLFQEKSSFEEIAQKLFLSVSDVEEAFVLLENNLPQQMQNMVLFSILALEQLQKQRLIHLVYKGKIAPKVRLVEDEEDCSEEL